MREQDSSLDPSGRYAPADRYWGKARPSAISGGPAWHLLPHHCLDVAAAGLEALERLPSLRRLLGSRLGLAEQELVPWVAFWLALHDLGKFAEAFQGQCPDVFQALRHRAPDSAKPYTLRHDSLGMLLWTHVLREKVIEDAWLGSATLDLADGLDFWARACTGHHGQPPKEGDFWGQHFDTREDREAALAFVTSARDLFLDRTAIEAIAGRDPQHFWQASQEISWWLAGLAVLADWIGSNTRYFAYHDRPQPLEQYWQHARRQAALAFDATGIAAPRSAEAMSFGGLFPSIHTASPLQRWAEAVPLPAGPQLHLLEDVTGAGKTEAALMLVHRLLAAGHAEGFYVALPTMATANAMYSRVAATYRRLFTDPASLALASSQRALVEEFAASVLPADVDERDPRQQDETASARCSAWLADHNKRALLAPAGVGTIDQALLAALHSKHQSLRLLGLVRKVLVIDEVHACDAYMQGVLERLLEFHARGGGSALLLSATLPRRMKHGLLTAFARGAGAPASPDIRADAYPLASLWSVTDDKMREEAIETRADVRRRVRVVTTSDASEIFATIEQALGAGRCVCWVRNTVADALAAWQMFEGRVAPENLLLFHARFALRDRLRMEERVLAAFGKTSTAVERAGRLLIATQVVEQSLDVDFDLLVSDLAPIDRVIQRAGRLARHRRAADGTPLADSATADERGEPCLWVLAPAWSEAPEPGWFKAAFAKAAAVYPHHGQLWLTARALREGGFAMPDDARRLIEGVFGDDAEVPPGLQANALVAEGEGYAALAQAQMNALALQSGYQRGGIDWWSEAKTPSRLGEATSTVLLARWVGAELRPWVQGVRDDHAWAYSSLRVAARLIDAEAAQADASRQAALEATKMQLPAQGRWSVLLPLAESDGVWTGQALAAPRRGQVARTLDWTYDFERGLRLMDELGTEPTLREDPEA